MTALVLPLCGPEFWRSLGEFEPYVVKTGDTGWERATGLQWVEFYQRHPRASALFNRAMAEHSRDAASGIVPEIGLSRFVTVVDAGGGDGTLLAEILRARPDLEGVLFDLYSGLEFAEKTLAAAGVRDRCQVVPG